MCFVETSLTARKMANQSEATSPEKPRVSLHQRMIEEQFRRHAEWLQKLAAATTTMHALEHWLDKVETSGIELDLSKGGWTYPRSAPISNTDMPGQALALGEKNHYAADRLYRFLTECGFVEVRRTECPRTDYVELAAPDSPHAIYLEVSKQITATAETAPNALGGAA